MMQRIETSNSSNTPNFIGSWILKDTHMCDEIVNFFEANPADQGVGAIGGGVDESQKKTTDIFNQLLAGGSIHQSKTEAANEN